MNLLKFILDKLHRCSFKKPIVSQYRSFNTRSIIFECKCGKREDFTITKSFGDPFPIETTSFLTNKEFERILKNDKVD